MQKNTAFIFGGIYSLLFAAVVSFVFYGKHEHYITHAFLIGWLLMAPFIYGVIYMKRQRDGGMLAGREGVKEGLRFVIVVIVLLSLFQVLFFENGFRDYKVNFMQTTGPTILKEQIAAGTAKITEKDIPGIIEEDVKQVAVSKEITSVVFKNLFYGAFCSFIIALILKRKQ